MKTLKSQVVGDIQAILLHVEFSDYLFASKTKPSHISEEHNGYRGKDRSPI